MPTNLTYKNPFIKIIENIKSASFESKALFFLLLLVSIHLLLYFNCFMVPSSDFFGFRNRALEYLSLSLPARFGRMPLYPILIGLFSKILPIKYPILIAAEIINLVLAIFSLLLIYRIARMFLKKGALVVVWLFALNPLFTELAIQPLLEPLLLVTILLTLYWELIKSRKSYLGAFLASITRYDAVVLIPILALKDLICRKKKLLTLGLGLLSATGITIWMILSIQHSVLINPYIDGFVSRGGLSPSAPVFFIHRLVYSVYSVVSFLPRSVFENALTGSLLSFVLVSLASGIMGVLGIIGIFSIIKNSFKDFSVILFFLLTCTAGHIIIGACVGRYIFPTLWIFYLVIVRGIECICEFVKKKYHTTLILQQNTLKFAASAGILGFVISNVYILKMPVKEFLMYIGYLLFIGLFLANITGKLSIKQVYLVIFACVFLSFPVKGNLSNTINRIDAAKWSLAEFRKVGEWYGKMIRKETEWS